MISKLKLFIAALVLVPCFVLAPVASAVANPDPLNAACQTNQDTRNSAVCKQAAGQGNTNPIAGPDGIISKAANIIALITGIGAIVMILLGGFFYVTSAGNTETATKARSRILSGLIGLVIVALAWSITRFISDRVLP